MNLSKREETMDNTLKNETSIELPEYDIEEVLNGGKNSKRRNLVFCETLFQLFSTLTIFAKYENHAPVDVVFTDDSDFSRAKEVLEKTDFFENIYTYEIHDKIYDLWHEYSPEDRLAFAEDPGSYVNDIELEHMYTDLWVNLDTMAPKMFFYKLKNMGMSPILHFVDEGVSSYVLDFSATKKDFINHRRLFGELAFSQRLGDMWLCEPRVYSGYYKDIPLYGIPKDILKNKEIISLFKNIFGEAELPKERFIFFEESFAAEGRTTNDLDLFREIVKVVGKDNIIVKRHPRNPIDRYSALGYKVMGMQSVPWEMMLLDNDVSDKVLISVGSSATLTPFYLYGMTPKAILLKKLLIGHVHYLADPKMDIFFNKVISLANERNVGAYLPNSYEGLDCALKYLMYNTEDDSQYAVQPEEEDLEEIEEDGFSLFDFHETEIIEDEEDDDIEEHSIDLETREAIIEEAKSKITGPYVSVVVPVYATEKYLRRCLDSLVFQTLDNIEILVVNDGSPDNSQEIIDEYAERFPDKIIPLIKENGGLSSARQFGTEHATGKYIGFVDSDDWVDYNYCEHCFNALVLENTKAVAFAVKHVYESGYVGNGIVADSDMPSFLMKSAASFWSKIYEREFFVEHAQFLHMWYEDIPVINPMLSYLDKLSVLKEHLYYYVRERGDSITNSKLDMRQLDYAKAEKIAIETTNPEYRKYQLARSISRILGNKSVAFYDHAVDFIKSYESELHDEEFLELLSPHQIEKLNKILDNQYQQNIPNTIYLNGFAVKDADKRLAIAEYYSNNAFWDDVKIVWLDESNCDINSDERIKALYESNNIDELAFVLSFKAIYENGGVYLNNNVIFSSTLNSLKYNTVYFGFIDKTTITKDIFGASKGNVVYKKALDIYSSHEDISLYDALLIVLVGFAGLVLNANTQIKFSQYAVYSPETFIYKINGNNISSVVLLNDDRTKAILDVSVYETIINNVASTINGKNNTIKNQSSNINSLKKRNEKLKEDKERIRLRVKKREAKIEKLQARVEKRDAKIDKLQARVDKRDEKINSLKLEARQNKKQLAKYEKQLVLYNKMSKSIIFKIYRKLFKIIHR